MDAQHRHGRRENRSGPPQRWFVALIAAAIILVILVQARFFLIPLAIAILLFSLTSAAIDLVARFRFGSVAIPNWLASIVAVLMISAILLALFGRGVDKVIIALVIVQWAYYARTVRSSAIVERRKDYIEAARCLALSHRRIMFRHLLPNCVPPLIVVATVQIAQAIALEATLSFLGVGVPVTEPSLGLLIANGYSYLLSGAYWISVYPGVALLIAIVAINLVGDQLRDVLNPRLRR